MSSPMSPSLHLPLHINTSTFCFDAAMADAAGASSAGPAAAGASSTTFCVDTQVLRDNLEKERYKRKHCIKQIHELQVRSKLSSFEFQLLCQVISKPRLGSHRYLSKPFSA